MVYRPPVSRAKVFLTKTFASVTIRASLPLTGFRLTSMTIIPDLNDDGHLRRVLYTAAFLLILVPAVQVGIQIWPLQLGNIQWRFSVANALSNGLLLPAFMGLTLLLTLARRLESRGMQLLAGGLGLLFVIGLGGSLALFVLDAMQLKAIVSTQMEGAFRSTALRVAAVSGLFLIAFAMLTLAAFMGPDRSPRKGGASRRQEEDDDAGAALIIGQ